MYHSFYRLTEPPFDLTPNSKYLFLTTSQREALSNVEYGLSSAKPVTVVIGEPGTGKTSLLRAALESERCAHVRCVYLNNPALTRDEFVDTLANRFQLSPAAARSKAVLLRELEQVLREQHERGDMSALVIDEAQGLNAELLEEIRLLGNIETETQKLLPLVLAGQPQLGERLEAPAMKQLKQRVALRCELAAFDLAETASYIGNRIRIAGGTPSEVFTQESVRLIHECSSGIPRTINVICDNALVSGMVLRRRPVDRTVVLEVCRDLALSRTTVVHRENREVTPVVAPRRDPGIESDIPVPAQSQSVISR
jgi:general secretion pathway protein A